MEKFSLKRTILCLSAVGGLISALTLAQAFRYEQSVQCLNEFIPNKVDPEILKLVLHDRLTGKDREAVLQLKTSKASNIFNIPTVWEINANTTDTWPVPLPEANHRVGKGGNPAYANYAVFFHPPAIIGRLVSEVWDKTGYNFIPSKFLASFTVNGSGDKVEDITNINCKSVNH